MRAATPVGYKSELVNSISIHAAHAGCDVNGIYTAAEYDISIHAAHAGCDKIAKLFLFLL